MIRLLLFLAAMCFPLMVFAQTPQTQYVDWSTGCGGNDGTIGNPYCSCTEWEAQNRNLMTEDVDLTVQFIGVGSGNINCTLNGWTADATRNITLNDIDIVTTNTGADVLQIYVPYTTVRGVKIQRNSESRPTYMTVFTAAVGTLVENAVFTLGPSWTDDFNGYYGARLQAHDSTLRNAVIETTEYVTGLILETAANKTMNIENVTIHSSVAVSYGLAIESLSGNVNTIVNLYNTLIQTEGTNYSTSGTVTVNSDANITKDATSPQTGLRNKTVAFVDAANDNYRLSHTATDAIDAGVTRGGFSTDADGNARPSGTAWDIGAYEYLQTETRYVRTDCANNGNGASTDCAGSEGAVGAYNKINLAYNDIVSDYTSLVTVKKDVTVDLAGVAADTQTATLDLTIPTNSTYGLHFYVSPANRHNGGKDTSKYRIVSTVASAAITPNSPNLSLNGIQLLHENATASVWAEGIVLREGTVNGKVVIQNSVIDTSLVVTTNSVGSIVCYAPYCGDGVQLQVVNNILFNKYYGMHLNMPGSRSFDIHNNTLYGGYRGIQTDGSTSGRRRLFNNVSQNTTNDDFALTGTGSTSGGNISEDGSSPQTGLRNITCSYTNAGTTMTLASSDTNCRDAGTDMSADSFFPFSYDMLGTIRPQNSVWDIGAHEITDSPPAPSATSLLILENY